jgi:hypothetical protein
MRLESRRNRSKAFLGRGRRTPVRSPDEGVRGPCTRDSRNRQLNQESLQSQNPHPLAENARRVGHLFSSTFVSVEEIQRVGCIIYVIGADSFQGN